VLRTFRVFVALSLCFLFFVFAAWAEEAGAPDRDAVASSQTVPDPPTEAKAPDGGALEEEAAKPTPSPEPTRAPVVSDDFELEVALGYDGLIMMARVTPFFITVTNRGADFDGLLGVDMFLTTTQYDRYEIPLTLASGATKRVLLPVKPMTRQDMYAIELKAGGEVVGEKRVIPAKVIAPEAVTVGLLTERGEAALGYMNQRANGLDTLRGETWVTIPLTERTFPETAEIMNSFTMLVVDGIDVRTLPKASQEALSAWLAKGGVVFVSGGAKAAAGYPFFTQWTGLEAGELVQAEDITPALIQYMTVSASPVKEGVWLSGLPAQGALVAMGEQGLVRLDRVGDGLIYTAAFDLAGKPLGSFGAMSSFWPRALRQSAPDKYMALLNRADENRHGNEGYQARQLTRAMHVANDESAVFIVLLLTAYLFLAGFGGYILLKRLDRREWLWGLAPASAIGFALILLLMSANARMNEPVALTASRVYYTGGEVQVATYIGVATPEGGELVIETDQPALPSVLHVNNYYEYDNPQSDRLFRPLDMRQRMRLGSRPKVGFASNDEWDPKMLKLDGVSVTIGPVRGRLWMEKDGVHGEVMNETEYTFTDCFVVTTVGFANVGDLLPGQRAEVAMLLPEKPIDFSDPAFAYKPGVMYATLDADQSAIAYIGDNLYLFAQEAVYGKRKAKDDPRGQQMSALVQLFDTMFQNYNNMPRYYFFGFNDKLGQVSAQINGKPVSRTAHRAVVAADMAFEPVGPTGQVMYHQGMIPAQVIVDMGGNQKPRLPAEADGNDDGSNRYFTTDTYLSIASPVAVRFVLPDYGKYTIEKMTLSGSSYDAQPLMYLYNHQTQRWDQQPLLIVSMSGERWAPYIDEEGAVYVRYTLSDVGNRYVGMQMPMIALKGNAN